MTVLTTQNLHKQYGKITAVDQLNLSIDHGTVFGLLGPNGSGKTTTLGMILGVTRPTGGSFHWFGEEANHQQRKEIGAILEKPNFYPTFSAHKNLQIACKIKEVGESRIPEVLELVDLHQRAHDPFRTYSLGMKQRLAIASALLANPKVLILDEPTNGLDPKGIAQIRSLITDIAQSGKTIILASHLLDEVQKVCEQFAILRNGKLIHQGHVDEDFNDSTKIEIGAENLNELTNAIKQYPQYISHQLTGNKLLVDLAQETRSSDVNRYLIGSGVAVDHIQVIKMNLEQKFMEILSDYD